MREYIVNRFCNTVTRSTVMANSEEEALEKVHNNEGCDGKDEIIESWCEIAED